MFMMLFGKALKILDGVSAGKDSFEDSKVFL